LGIEPVVHSGEITLAFDVREPFVYVGVAQDVTGHLEQDVVLLEDVLAQQWNELPGCPRECSSVEHFRFAGGSHSTDAVTFLLLGVVALVSELPENSGAHLGK
jgi:hypothetical protein